MDTSDTSDTSDTISDTSGFPPTRLLFRWFHLSLLLQTNAFESALNAEAGRLVSSQ